MPTHTVVFDDRDLVNDTFTVTKLWRATWWKRPFLWLCGKPTKTVERFEHCRVTDMVADAVGGVAVDFVQVPSDVEFVEAHKFSKEQIYDIMGLTPEERVQADAFGAVRAEARAEEERFVERMRAHAALLAKDIEHQLFGEREEA